ncbi:AFR484Cp [Eremothecium gossypii ATCC 10895]|uniref:AFR484Cp n=1 Tax=Eremothecium gossypii (strain ATCC 10895 / CBS 109.51 / FGSC 9923 / NRRL Y-1056) TaxID=284811 RepID=Q752T9_EREGS|nr:AFR484Cp [Eremothecium gossypii ATCC 10895]AAS53855.2 AFR484Cp [Eremothecium gossypii ATCC 10895]
MSNDECLLPRREDIGIQLGIGISAPSLYLSADSRTAKEHKTQWIEAYTGPQDSSSRRLDIINSTGRLLADSQGPISGRNVDTEDFLSDDEFPEDVPDIAEIADERSLLLSNAFNSASSWKDIFPVLPTPFSLFAKAGAPSASMFKAHADAPITNKAFVPKVLLSSLQNTSFPATVGADEECTSTAGAVPKISDFGFKVVDPTRLQLCTAGRIQTTSDLRQEREGRGILAFVSGETNSTLNLSLLIEPEDSQSNDACMQAKSYEIHNNVNKLDLLSPIKNIKIPRLSTTLNRDSNAIGIITETALVIVTILAIDAPKGAIKTQQLEPLDFTQLEQFPVVDVAFNPWNLDQFAVIDTKGNWCVGDVARSKKKSRRLRLLRKFSGTIFDPEEYSNWNMIEWSHIHTRLLVMNRSTFMEIDFVDGWQQEIVQAKTWSNLRDFKRLSDESSVLLTCKEIIFLDHKQQGTKRALSWKHNWDSKDSSLKLAIHISGSHMKQYLHAFLFSTMTPAVLMVSFFRSDTTFQVSSNPRLLVFPINTPGITDITFPFVDDTELDDSTRVQFPIVVRASKGARIWSYQLADTEYPSSQSGSQNVEDSMNTSFSAHTDVTVAGDQADISRFVRLMHASIPQRSSDHDIPDEYNKFQEYGYKLSELMNKRIENWTSEVEPSMKQEGRLSQLTSGPGNLGNIEEFSSLLRQFIQYYQEHGITFNGFEMLSRLLIHERSESIDLFFNKLLQCWEPVSEAAFALTMDIVTQVALQVLAFRSANKIEEFEKHTYESLPENSKHILDLWDCEDPSSFESQNSTATPKTNLASIQSSMPFNLPPSIRQSQNPPALQSSLPETTAPAFSLSSQPPQSQSTQRQSGKRKKRRIGGFG